jgi:hypothetical protein
VPAILTWARDLDAMAQRMRQLDEQNKIVSFWDNWMKTVAAAVPPDSELNTRTEYLIGVLVGAARHELANAGRNVMTIYRQREFVEFEEFKLDFARFQRFRAALPWYRRAFLLYRSPNAAARVPKLLFHLTLVSILATFIIATVVGITLGAVGFRPHPVALPPLLQAALTFHNAHSVAFNIFAWTYLICVIWFFRQSAIWRENDRSLYIRDQFRSRYGDPRAKRDAGVKSEAEKE